MVSTYSEAVDLIQNFGWRKAIRLGEDGESIPIHSALGRICCESYHSPSSTPRVDTSAMDGFAVNSAMTTRASAENPMVLRIIGTIAAGDERQPIPDVIQEKDAICIEIMTGAPFPSDEAFDACIKVEETISVRGPDPGLRYIQISKPAQRWQNRRFAGSDFQQGDSIISQGTTLKPHHVMALAALGIGNVKVHRKLRIGVISTGSELLSHESLGVIGSGQIRDSNGPYIEAVLAGLGVEVTNLGIVEDNAKKFQSILLQSIEETSYDAVITSGAVSMGKYDFVGAAIQAIGAKIQFHKTTIRPGHPVLFATLPRQVSQHRGVNTPPVSPAHENIEGEPADIAFFGLPGNPLASAVCLRFMVIPYLRALLHLPEEVATRALLRCSPSTAQNFRKPSHLQVFWHGKRSGETGQVTISGDQGSNKIHPLLEADCWVGIPPGREEVGPGDVVETYEMYPPLGC